MPIHLSTAINAISQDQFHAIDRVVFGHAIDIHNQFGRLLDEAVYKSELAQRCSQSGLLTAREVVIRVHHGVFSKDFFIDLLIGSSTVIEAKTVAELTDGHRAQGINYL